MHEVICDDSCVLLYQAARFIQSLHVDIGGTLFRLYTNDAINQVL